MPESYDPPGLALPYYFSYYRFPGKMVDASNGGAAIWRISADSGGWEPRNDIADDILFGTTQDVQMLSRTEFVQEVEWVRGRYLRGDGPVFALYDTIRAVEETAEAENRRLTGRERLLVEGLRRRTYVMFETELLRQGDPAADPTLAD
ncbi:hypothetical protein J2S43_008033 [Catenuloplanes nepalensis]|uniref:Uncharacterized protein n=1 Tax=Catenuloplanes nepalensis TaxID=587533 RepID=A0ABT9N8G8_9ACTN|nr:hypothetical protein [Catenuloplanes nepalensis]MDP9799521.1 hypothetical protein [Catenuloplanes nepalensis]